MNNGVRYVNVAAITAAGNTRSTQIMTKDRREAHDMLEDWMLRHQRDRDPLVVAVISDPDNNITHRFAIDGLRARLIGQEK